MPNEIETIAILDSVRFIHLPPDRRTEICDALKTAMQALREKAERNKGCVWCKSDNKVTHNGEHFCFFCSYCGKRLEVEP